MVVRSKFARGKNFYQNLFERVFSVWYVYSIEYRTILDRYNDLLLEKQALGIEPLRKINERDLKEFPEIEFLEITDEEEAEDYLLELSVQELEALNTILDLYLDGYLLRTLRNKISDFWYEIRRYNSPKTPLGYHPDFKEGKVATAKHPRYDERF